MSNVKNVKELCIQCGAAIPKPIKSPGRVKIYCGAECRKAAAYKRRRATYPMKISLPFPCRECGTMFIRQSREQVLCSSKCREERSREADKRKRFSKSKPPIPCTGCGIDVPQPKGNRPPKRFCTSTCRSSYGATQRELRKRQSRHRPPAAQFTKTCSWCNLVFVTTSSRANYCSRLCSDASYNKNKRRVAAKPQVTKQCARCMSEFTSRQPHATFCSKRCQKAASKRHRAHVKRSRSGGGKQFSISVVGNRDNWTCHLCGNPVPNRKFSGLADDPTQDHVVPLSAGGAHVIENVRLAHFMCNSRRGARLLPGASNLGSVEQGALFYDR